MSVSAPVVPHPFVDPRFKLLDAAMKRFRYQPDALLEILHVEQELFGYLDPACLAYVSRCLRVPPSRVYGVATFYNFFTLKPAGEHTCVVCMGTACYVKGATAILGAVESSLGVTSGHTTPDGAVSLVTARCLGACGVAPAMVFDTEVTGKNTPASAVARLAPWKRQ